MAHVVIADPDYSIRKLLEHVVTLLGWTCDTAASGPEAWQLIEKTRPNLLIAEVALSRLSGIELVGSLRHHPTLSGIPVVLISSPDREQAARSAGCTAFVSKPFHVETLLQLLARLVPAEQRE